MPVQYVRDPATGTMVPVIGSISQAQADARYLQKAGGTMTGDIVLKGDPTAVLHPATKQYADASVTGHEAAADPHGQYQKESEKGAANGYAPLGADSKVPAANLPAASSSGHTVQDEGVSLAARSKLDFAGAAVAVTDVAGSDKTLVTVSTPNIIVLGKTDPVPGGTPVGTVIVRKDV
jgi:hypothetical protein